MRLHPDIHTPKPGRQTPADQQDSYEMPWLALERRLDLEDIRRKKQDYEAMARIRAAKQTVTPVRTAKRPTWKSGPDAEAVRAYVEGDIAFSDQIRSKLLADLPPPTMTAAFLSWLRRLLDTGLTAFEFCCACALALTLWLCDKTFGALARYLGDWHD